MNTNILGQAMAYETTKALSSFINNQLKIWRKRKKNYMKD